MPRISKWHAKLSLAAAMAADDDMALSEELEYEAAIAVRIGDESRVTPAADAGLSAVPVPPAHRPYSLAEDLRQPSGVT